MVSVLILLAHPRYLKSSRKQEFVLIKSACSPAGVLHGPIEITTSYHSTSGCVVNRYHKSFSGDWIQVVSNMAGVSPGIPSVACWLDSWYKVWPTSMRCARMQASWSGGGKEFWANPKMGIKNSTECRSVIRMVKITETGNEFQFLLFVSGC